MIPKVKSAWFHRKVQLVALKGAKNQNKGTNSQTKPQGPRGLCTVSAVSRGHPAHQSLFTLCGSTTITYCTKNKRFSLWAAGQEKATSGSLLQRGRYSDRPSPTAAESNNIPEEGKWAEDDRRQIVGQKRFTIFLNQMHSLGMWSFSFRVKNWIKFGV